MKLIDSEKSLWRWRGAQSNPPPADYNARDAHSETAEVVPMPVIGGELGLQSIMHNALIELANMFVAEKDNLAGDKWKGAIWNWAQHVGSGTADFSNFQYDETSSTMSANELKEGVARAIFELKLGLTRNDLDAFIKGLKSGTLCLRYSGNSITVTDPNGKAVTFGLGFKFILAQVSVFKLCSTGQLTHI